ncbi:MAG TPA: copper homeostasis protein CutC [Porphyromonadaceae bacterium]|nr:copper homeostasis protein CutC [Porphyromonadaceae bacterium]
MSVTNTSLIDYTLEVCANSLASCLEAQKGGARRVELCAAVSEGGITPSYGEILLAREHLSIKLHVIIRPRGGDFLYSDLEHRVMLKDIEMARSIGVDGVVIGCLTPQGEVDMPRNRELIDAALGLDVTFHRAFDRCRDPFDSLEKIIELGCSRILTSGQQPKAEQGVALLKELVQRAAGRIVIMPGSGIHEENIAAIAARTGAREFHLSARVPRPSLMTYKELRVPISNPAPLADPDEQAVTSARRVAATLERLNHPSLR